MSITVEGWKKTGENEVTVAISAASQQETSSSDARKTAISFAQQYLGKCGFDNYGDWGYRNPPTKEHPKGQDLTETELSTPGVRKPGGVYTRNIKIRGSI